MIYPVIIIKNVINARKINPKQIDKNKIFIGEGLIRVSLEPTPIKSLKTLIKKYSSNHH